MLKRSLAPLAFAVMVTFVPPAVGDTTSNAHMGAMRPV